jgi:hypothetical protein
MANKILADLGLSPLNKFLLVYWFSLGFIVLDQLSGNATEITTTFAELGPVTGTINVVAIVLILYGAYLLYNKKKQGAQIAIAANVVMVAYFVFIVGQTPIPLEGVVIYIITFIVMVAGPVLLFPDEYS